MCVRAAPLILLLSKQKMTHQISWELRWRPDAPERYQVTDEVATAIRHSIDGLNPHRPVFQSDRCYAWKLWNCVVLKAGANETVQMHIRTPFTPAHSRRSQNLRSVLAYHYFGHLDPPVTSSRKPCVCGSGQTYGVCCFPTVYSRCGGACVNPLHFVCGKNSEAAGNRTGDGATPAVILPCAPCHDCAWEPYKFMIANGVFGVHREACETTVHVAPRAVNDVNRMLDHWRNEGIRNVADHSDHAKRYLKRHRDDD